MTSIRPCGCIASSSELVDFTQMLVRRSPVERGEVLVDGRRIVARALEGEYAISSRLHLE